MTQREKLANEIRGGNIANIGQLVGRQSNMPIESYKMPIHRIISQTEPMRFAAHFVNSQVKTSRVTSRSACKGRTPFYRIATQPCIRSVSRRRMGVTLLYFKAQCRVLHFQITWNLTETRQRNPVRFFKRLYISFFHL